jgi:DNA mismatch endonuclease (patch repair protein)
MDSLSSERRSWNMSRIRGKNTRPEILLRKALFARGLRYRLHVKDLPGTPDIVFRTRRLAIFVNGCFWHRHEGCDLTTTPTTRREFWQEKFDATVERDRRNIEALNHAGWRVVVVWECEIEKNLDAVADAIEQRLKDVDS